MGQGPDLVCSTPSPDRTAFDPSRRVWRRAARRLVNLPGFGARRRPGRLAQFADRIAEELPKLGLSGKADLLGNGFGGFVSVALAVRHGALFERLVLSTPAPPSRRRAKALSTP